MADEVKRVKAIRVSKLSTFTRKKNHLQQLLEGGGNPEKLKKVFDELEAAFKVLEQAQEDVLVMVEEDTLEAELTYMDAPSEALAAMDVKISTAEDTHKQSQAEQQTWEERAANEARKQKEVDDARISFNANMEAFGQPSENLGQTSAEKRVSLTDMRAEMKKLEDSFSKLLQDKTKLLALDSAIDLVQEN